MRYLLYLNLIALLLATSCAPAITKGLHKEGRLMVAREQLPPLLDVSSGLHRYNMTVDIKKNHFSGLLLIKQMEQGIYRILFSTHFGLSVFDFELNGDSLQVHQCIEPLRKKRLLNLLHKDFSTLLGLNLLKENPGIYYKSPDTERDIAYRLTQPPGKGYYRKDNLSGELLRIQTGRGITKSIFCRETTGSDSMATVRIRHPFIGLEIGVEQLK